MVQMRWNIHYGDGFSLLFDCQDKQDQRLDYI